MNDEAVVSHYGNPDLPSRTEERPLATFALFAFNQERFIREAIEGAFAQTYSPLEIILSDDCSSDATPAILEEMAATYRGPHKVIVRRGTRNIGTLAHVLQAARLASGEIFVVGAGDDISLPQRTEQILAAFAKSEAIAYSSDEFILDGEGRLTPLQESEVIQRQIAHARMPSWLHGATAAYRTQFLRQLPLPQGPVLFEDLVFRELLKIMKATAIRSPERLIQYREHDSNIYKRGTSEHSEKRKRLEWFRLFQSYGYCADLLGNPEGAGITTDRTASAFAALRMRRRRDYFYGICDPERRSIREKLSALASAPFLGQRDYPYFRIALKEFLAKP